jgi:diaminohydroxyphosphoribosylaminopyrimidine deaminase/5-amino-6-(5-phosphoribosylamino)uracil reductase
LYIKTHKSKIVKLVPMAEPDHNKFMQRCIDLATRSEGLTYPNPMVGAVIVYKGTVIGEGYHVRAGGPHAEVVAVGSVRDKSLLRESTLYVSLEPCSHFGKTPPCTELIIESGIPEIFIGTMDTSEKVSGRGMEILRKAGCKVTNGVLEEQCRKVNRRFFTWHEKKRPWVVLKWAQSSDRFIDTFRTSDTPLEPNWISGKPERVLVHRWRSEEQAILVGAETFRKDNPGLNVRYWGGNDPVVCVLSGSGNLGGYTGSAGNRSKIFVFTMNPDAETGEAERVLLDNNIPAASQILGFLYGAGLQSLFIEGGSKVLNHFIENDLWDEARIITGRSMFREGIPAPVVKGRTEYTTRFESTSLEVVSNRHEDYLSG